MLRIASLITLIISSVAFAKGGGHIHYCPNIASNYSGKYDLSAIICLSPKTDQSKMLPVPKQRLLLSKTENFCKQNEYNLQILSGGQTTNDRLLIYPTESTYAKLAWLEFSQKFVSVEHGMSTLTITGVAREGDFCPAGATQVTSYQSKLW